VSVLFLYMSNSVILLQSSFFSYSIFLIFITWLLPHLNCVLFLKLKHICYWFQKFQEANGSSRQKE
jgi:hypothetical protein